MSHLRVRRVSTKVMPTFFPVLLPCCLQACSRAPAIKRNRSKQPYVFTEGATRTSRSPQYLVVAYLVLLDPDSGGCGVPNHAACGCLSKHSHKNSPIINRLCSMGCLTRVKRNIYLSPPEKLFCPFSMKRSPALIFNAYAGFHFAKEMGVLNSQVGVRMRREFSTKEK